MTDLAALSIDFELFRHTPAYRSADGTLDPDRTATGLEAWPFLRDLLSEYGAEATFFVVGELAETHPETVTAIADAGHEVASHTYSHRLLGTLDPEQRRTELVRSRSVLRDATGQEVAGFRAPAFEFGAEHFEELERAEYEYDSSVVPARSVPGWYGGTFDTHRPTSAAAIRPGAPASIAEVPLSVAPFLRLPLSGAWTRLIGRRYTLAGLRRLRSRGVSPVLYYHPWELVDLPAVEGVPRRVYWRTGDWLRETLRAVLEEPFEFVPVGRLTAAGSDQ